MRYVRLAVFLGLGCAGRVPNGTQELTYEYKGKPVTRQQLQRLDDAALEKVLP